MSYIPNTEFSLASDGSLKVLDLEGESLQKSVLEELKKIVIQLELITDVKIESEEVEA